MKTIAIIGGGAAGYFCAANINTKEFKLNIYEQGQKVLKKVKISGGGRCNVTHNIFNEKIFCTNYPRGEKELLPPFKQFQAVDTLKWFLKKGVQITAEEDGRMFPTTNDSQTIINCLTQAAKKNRASLLSNHKVSQINFIDQKFQLVFSDQTSALADKVLICTGSSPGGYKLAEQLGHSITDRAPSLFSFKIKHPCLKDLSGVSFKECQLRLTFANTTKKFKSKGPVLITHWGLSGPAILKLSAWAAREMKQENYKAKIFINLTGQDNLDELTHIKINSAKINISNAYPNSIPKRFWENLLLFLKIEPSKKWGEITKKELNILNQNLNSIEFNINGQNRFKDEFVECGGVNLKEINFKTMESKIQKGLYFAGEILDIDGVTGGFNFQNAWTTAWITAQNITRNN